MLQSGAHFSSAGRSKNARGAVFELMMPPKSTGHQDSDDLAGDGGLLSFGRREVAGVAAPCHVLATAWSQRRERCQASGSESPVTRSRGVTGREHGWLSLGSASWSYFAFARCNAVCKHFFNGSRGRDYLLGKFSRILARKTFEKNCDRPNHSKPKPPNN